MRARKASQISRHNKKVNLEKTEITTPVVEENPVKFEIDLTEEEDEE